jgi:mono/diheme cytochrome c family protein
MSSDRVRRRAVKRSRIVVGRGSRLVATVTVLLAVCGFYSVASRAAAPVPGNASQGSMKSIWDGVYTEAQAERGKAQYVEHCASCHSENLQGGDEAPGLASEAFLAPWIDLSVGDLYERIRISMPQDRPGLLSRAAYADILAYMFKANRFPAGEAELASETAALKQIGITVKPQK